MNSFAMYLAVEEPEITNICIYPGRVDTAMQKDLRESGSGSMLSEEYEGFVTAFQEGSLLKPEQPGHVMAKFVVDAKPELSGRMIR